MELDKESINEHIRNGLSPFKVLLDLCKTGILTPENNLQFYNDLYTSCENSLNNMLRLGINSYEEVGIWQK